MEKNAPDGEMISTVKWLIYETATKSLVCRGETTVNPSDVEIKKVGTISMKKIELGAHFNFSLAENTEKHGRGFGLKGDRDDEQTFSWDWFVIDRVGHANKLQESGELSFETTMTQSGSEISRMEFLTDVCIRIADRSNKNPLNPTWRIMIFAGSIIWWPVAAI
ncbi:MAG: hypothetical protein SGJ27_29935 [Candidatus Melainabacteria bacterium]|nr:hypothetical protein [Candidatus Melainabacteria bacterium]